MTRLPQNVRVTDPATGGKRWSTYVYDDWGRKTSVTRFTSAPAGEQATSTYGYTDDPTTSCLTSVTGAEGQARTFQCNADGERTRKQVTIRAVSVGGTEVQPAQTRTTDYTRDALGRITRVDLPGAGASTVTYDRSGRVTETKVLMRGTGSVGTDWAVTSFAYDDWPGPSSNRTMTETYPDPDPFSSAVGPASVTHTYDWVGNEISRTDVRNPALLWLTGYDATDRVISTTSPDPDGGGALLPLSTSTTYAITSAEYSVAVTDPAGVESKSWMDALGRPVQTKSGTLASTWLRYDAVGNVTRVQTSDDPIGQGGGIISWRENDFDAFGDPTALREPALVGGTPTAQTTLYTYHADTGRLLSVDGPLPDSTDQRDRLDYTWDRSGRLKTSKLWTKPTQGFLTTITYDDAGEQVRIASELASDGSKMQIRDFSYNTRGFLDLTTEYHGSIGSVQGAVVFDNNYDLEGRVTSIDSPVWPQASELRFAYDDLGQETARYRDTGSGQADRIDTTYLADGLVGTTSRAGGATYAFGYDKLGRPTNLTDGTNQTSWSYYGDTYEASQRGWLKQMTTPAGATSYLYYEVGELGGSPGQLEALDDPLSGGQTTYVYDEGGRVIYRDDPAGLSWWREYEPETGLVDTQEISNIGTPHETYAWFDLGYDVAGNVTSRVEKLWRTGATNISDPQDAGTGSWSYTYDGAGRMLTAQGPNPVGTQRTRTYSYDGQGNRLTEQLASVTDTYTTDDQGWPASMDSSATGAGTDVTYTLDPDGDLLGADAAGTAEDLAFAYDSWGGTDSATAGSASIDYTLDAFGRTTRRTQGTSVTDLVYAGATEDLAKTVEGGVTTLYDHSPGGPLASKEGSAPAEFYLRDLHGDVVGTMATGGTSLTDTLWYSPYGEQEELTGGPTALGYQGDWTDAATGTVDMLTRDYMPTLGRFTTRDVLGGDPADPPSLNQYVYTEGSPVTYSDPTGMVTTAGDYTNDEPTCGTDTACGGNTNAGVVQSTGSNGGGPAPSSTGGAGSPEDSGRGRPWQTCGVSTDGIMTSSSCGPRPGHDIVDEFPQRSGDDIRCYSCAEPVREFSSDPCAILSFFYFASCSLPPDINGGLSGGAPPGGLAGCTGAVAAISSDCGARRGPIVMHDKPVRPTPEDPDSWRGLRPEDVGKHLPGWKPRSSTSGGGIVYVQPGTKGSNIVKVMPGYPDSDIRDKRGPYLRISWMGKKSPPIPLAGNPSL